MAKPVFLLRLLTLLAPLLIFSSGCRQATDPEPALIRIHAGDEQAGRPGARSETPLRVEVLSRVHRGLLGGRGRRLPVSGAIVRFSAVETDTGVELRKPAEVVTDAGGFAETDFHFGDKFGDHYIRARVEEDPSLSVVFRLISGVEKNGDRQETLAGNKLPEPIALTVFDSEGRPQPEVDVFFRLVRQPGSGARLTETKAVTDAKGTAETELLTTPGKTGTYEIIAEVADQEKGFSTRSISFTAMTVSRWRVAFGVLGGLGIFIFGMKTMSDGLRQLAGSKLRSFLHFFTRSRLSAIAAGAFVTGLIQSSTACTIMVVGFVNAGLLTLQQSIGVIFGANIGTTITGQMISLDIHELSLPAIILGVAGFMACRRARTRNIFQTILGFGLLFLGMQMMSSELREISSLPSFAQVFQAFDCRPGENGIMPLLPVLGAIAIGTLMTVLVQSSSATIGLTIALSISGLINFYTAVPLILGDNIGTTITAILASIGANRRTRQTAIAHTMFNLFGAAYMLGLFYIRIGEIPVFLYLVDLVTSGNVFAEVPENIGRHVASAHTLFNVFNVIIFIPFIPFIAFVCNFIMPVAKEQEPTYVQLEPHLLQTPSIALQQSIYAMSRMTETAWKMARKTVKLFRKSSLKDQESLVQQENGIDEMQKKTIQYLTELTRRPLSENQAEVIPLLIHCVNDAERIGDHGINILALTRQLIDDKLTISKSASRELEEICDRISSQAKAVITALGMDNGNEPIIMKALKIQGEISQGIRNAEKKHLKRLEKKKCSVATGILYTEILGDLERIAGHLANIAERTSEIKKKYWHD